MNTRNLAIAFAALRIVYAVGLLAAPGRVARSWVGDDAGSPGGAVAVRGLGARDLALAAGTAVVSRRGGDVRPWLVATAASDAADVCATLAAPKGSLPDKAKPGTVALAGAFGVAGAVLASRDELAG